MPRRLSHRQFDSLFGNFFRQTSTNRISALLTFYEVSITVAGWFPSQRASYVEGVLMPWHDMTEWRTGEIWCCTQQGFAAKQVSQTACIRHYKCNFLKYIDCMSIRIPLQFIQRFQLITVHESTLVQVMACRLLDDRPLPEPMLTQFAQTGLFVVIDFNITEQDRDITE